MFSLNAPRPVPARFDLEAKIRLSILELMDCEESIACYGWWLGEYIYIGKSIKVRTRALSHISIMERRLGSLVLRDIEIHLWPCENEFYNNIMEGKLIVRYNPKYNKNSKLIIK